MHYAIRRLSPLSSVDMARFPVSFSLFFRSRPGETFFLDTRVFTP